MNKIFTQIALGMVCLFANVANAQVNENFNNGLAPLVSNCWNNVNFETVAVTNGQGTANPIEGTYSIRQTDATKEGILSTPFYNISTALNVTFKYKLTRKLNNGASRLIEVGTTDKNGIFKPIDNKVSLTVSSPSQGDKDAALTYNGTINADKAESIYRLTIRISGTASDGNATIYIDGLNIKPTDPTITTMPLHYASSCNAKPETTPDTYTMVGYNMFPFTRSVLANDIEKDGETMITTLEVPSPDGNVVLKADGTFTFKPNADFTGTSTTFTYRATDNGYDAAYSTAVVTINLIEASTLPVAFVNFSGSVNNNKAQLAWSVADNETGNHFQVEKSNDGKTFQTIATVMCSAVSGQEKYNFNDASFNTNGTFYRIKAVNNDQSKTYTQTIYIKGTTSSNGNKLTLLQNPVSSTSLTFNFEATISSQAEVTIYSFTGSKMHTQKLAVSKGNNTVSLPLSSQYTTGHYILEVKTADNRSTAKFVKL